MPAINNNNNNVESMEMSQQPNMAAQTQTTNEQPVSTLKPTQPYKPPSPLAQSRRGSSKEGSRQAFGLSHLARLGLFQPTSEPPWRSRQEPWRSRSALEQPAPPRGVGAGIGNGHGHDDCKGRQRADPLSFVDVACRGAHDNVDAWWRPVRGREYLLSFSLSFNALLLALTPPLFFCFCFSW